MAMNPRLLRPLQRRGLLDLVPGAAAAYSLRSLSRSYAGPVVTVRRSSDDAEEDFTAAEVSNGTLAAFCGAGDGFVKTWHSQIGSNNASQTTAGYQPKIVSSGVVILEEGKPALQFDGSDDYMDATGVSVSQPDTIFSVNTSENPPNNVYDGITSRQALTQIASTSNFERFFAGTSVASSTLVSPGEQFIFVCLFDGASSKMFRDSVLIASGNAGANNLDGLRIGCFEPGTAHHSGTIQEIVIFPSDMSSQRELIEGNIAWSYS
jgi:hypothetical protein